MKKSQNFFESKAMTRSAFTTSNCKVTRMMTSRLSVSENVERLSRWIITFCNILTYPPEDYSGIIVLRLTDQARPYVLAVLRRILPLLATQPLVGHLWTVDDVGMRIRPGVLP